MIEVVGKGGITARVILHSVSAEGKEILTYELEDPRFIHAEFMTHRVFSRNAASSRAIPVKKVIEQVRNNPAMPIHWGANQSGMQAKQELTGIRLKLAKASWKLAAKAAAGIASGMNKIGLHKQLANRILEPFQMIKVVCTATEFDNFFWLRDHADAQPEIRELAKVMLEARALSKPQLLEAGEWHLPYVSSEKKKDEGIRYYISDWDYVGSSMQLTQTDLSLADATKLSASLCAQVSYRKADESLAKALKIYNQLVTMVPVHASPMEHQATPMGTPTLKLGVDYTHPILGVDDWEEGVTHIDKKGNFWAGNFQGWIQYRQLIKGNVFTGDINERY